ncbi:hypothetical protein DWB79_04195 [Treponema medium]|uniref:Uncharacterized protein n=2 Tax=Treponema medium TaxID=58231 RepID=A0AA87NTS6_TREMD|nr:hypothetical protein [Treponema medium]EPF29323.1 hypothetical protein HMPREF9195_00832 [Treponema medium ATCC 700293]QSH96971.1 hypothetical protein DWB79_04195 [Treponema medium]
MKHNNPKKTKKLEHFPRDSVDMVFPVIKEWLSFNFKYFDGSQSAGQNFTDWTKVQLEKLFEKLKWYSSDSKLHWQKTSLGHGGLHCLEVYGDFPSGSAFTYPKHIPSGVQWARFRLEGDMRLIGFFIDKDDIPKEDEPFTHIFYIVFLDAYHQFYNSDNNK